jgi:Tol biopolymer transport system component
MKILFAGMGTITVLLAVSPAAQELKTTASHFSVFSDYLGQTPPGDTPVIFAQGIVSTGNLHSRLAISPDSKEMFWTAFDMSSGKPVAKLMHVAYRNGQWTNSQTPSFASMGEIANPLFSPDGKKLFFNRKEGNSGWTTQYVERTDSGWCMPRSDGFLLNTSSSFTRSGTVYFSDAMTGKLWNRGTYSAQYSPNGYLNRQALDTVINSPYIDYTPYISPDETYLMFSSSRPLVDENMFLFISFRNTDGTWSRPQKMNEKMNLSGNARFPTISPDGKYLFFCGDDGNMYWVDIKVIEKMRPQKQLESKP